MNVSRNNLEKKYDDAMKKMNQKYNDLEQKHKNEIDALKATVTELQRKSQLQLGSWQSSADKNKVKRWNHVIIAPTTANLFRLEDEDTRIKVLKSGIYHIRGDAHASSTHWTGFVRINGADVTYHVNAISSGSYVQFSFDVTRRLNANDYIVIHANVASYNSQRHNTLTVQRIGD